jgi:NAD(P)-dependent dehydrogenase (short-subunit alcohol dehydrogenase family)
MSYDYWTPFVAPVTNYLTLICLSWLIGKHIAKHLMIPRLLTPLSPKGRAVFITGCDSGFGNMTSIALNKLGFFVFSGVLDPESEGSKALSQQENIRVIKMDVTNSEEVLSAVATVESFLTDNTFGIKELHSIINNAGIAAGGEIEWSAPGSVADYESHIAVNTLGVIRVTRAFLPLIRRSKGRVVNLSSILGRTSLPGLTAYSVSKAATAKFTEGLQSELARFGVMSIDVEPWFFKTPMLNTKCILENMRQKWLSSSPEVRQSYGGDAYFERMIHAAAFTVSHPKNVIQTPEDVVNSLVDAVTSPEPDAVYRVITRGFGLVFWIVNDFLPWDILIYIRRAIDILPQFHTLEA